MHINYRYVLAHAARAHQHLPGCAILDYGCGRGAVVHAGRSLGYHIFGCEVFHAGEKDRQAVTALGLTGDQVREIVAGRIDFPDHTFDLVISNQVFEHVADLDLALSEICRVMKPTGTLLTLFPSKDVIREGHIGIPMAHWFQPGSRLRYAYTLALRRMGVGKPSWSRATPEQFSRDSLNYLDRYTYYRTRAELSALFSNYFEWQNIEADFINFRLANTTSPLHGLMRLGMRLPLIKQFGAYLFTKLGGMVIQARPKHA